MENYNSEEEYFKKEVFEKAYFGYWDTETEFSKAIDEFLDSTINGKVVKEPLVKNMPKGLEGLKKLKEIKDRLDVRREELREVEKKLHMFKS